MRPNGGQGYCVVTVSEWAIPKQRITIEMRTKKSALINCSVELVSYPQLTLHDDAAWTYSSDRLPRSNNRFDNAKWVFGLISSSYRVL